MAWHGYFTYAGNEFINATRTETYAKNAGIGWFKPLFRNDVLPYMVGDGLTYTTPLLDNAPWADSDIPESHDFYGFYPLDITGIEDSTRESTVVESITDGGTPGRLRHKTRSIVFNGVLVAGSDCAADYGMRWLKTLLLGNPCGTSMTSMCNGSELCYLSCGPDMDMSLPEPGFDPEECLDPFLRSLRKVVINNGPTLTRRHDITDGGAAWVIQFTAVAGSPFEFGTEVPVIAGLLDPEVPVPWVGGVSPEGGYIDLTGYQAPEESCAVATYQPIYDPECPAVIPPPEPPSVPLGCYSPPQSWHRRQFTIPQQFIPLWGDVVPRIAVHARTIDVRNLRLRFYSDVTGDASIQNDPCAYCGDIVVSYVPMDHTLVLDGVDQVVYVQGPGGERRRADSLVFKTDGTPFEWPALSCGFGYIVTLDLPKTQAPPVVDLSLFARAA